MAEKPNQNKISPALLIIDVQNKFLATIPPRDKELGILFINMLIELFRKANLPLLRIYHQNSENGPFPGSAEFEYPDAIHIIPEDIQIVKSYSDSFNKTSLNQILADKGVNTLFLCGLSAVGCVLATKIGALNNDFEAFMVKDAIMSHNSEYTRNMETMFNAVSYDVVKLIVDSSAK